MSVFAGIFPLSFVVASGAASSASGRRLVNQLPVRTHRAAQVPGSISAKIYSTVLYARSPPRFARLGLLSGFSPTFRFHEVGEHVIDARQVTFVFRFQPLQDTRFKSHAHWDLRPDVAQSNHFLPTVPRSGEESRRN
jgi:hypothetical protein